MDFKYEIVSCDTDFTRSLTNPALEYIGTSSSLALHHRTALSARAFSPPPLPTSVRAPSSLRANSSEKINTLFYLVQLHTEAYDPDESSRYVRFICTLEDLQDLILKLREMFSAANAVVTSSFCMSRFSSLRSPDVRFSNVCITSAYESHTLMNALKLLDRLSRVFAILSTSETASPTSANDSAIDSIHSLRIVTEHSQTGTNCKEREGGETAPDSLRAARMTSDRRDWRGKEDIWTSGITPLPRKGEVACTNN
uniref:Uncharacterized protein n=1 Tax=Timema poppense TaxID=170557 RepID=A0A7R9CLD5_TIMPO|nr:unnamed protein product [Timema poppensis]